MSSLSGKQGPRYRHATGESDPYETIGVEKLTPIIGAEISGVDIGKLVSDDAAAVSTAKLQRQIDELRAEVKHEQDARKELEELLDQNAENLEQTIQDYEAKLEALGAGADDARVPKPKKSRQG